MGRWVDSEAYLVGVTLALEGAAKIVDNDAGAARAIVEGVGLAEATTGAGNDDDLVVVSQLLRHDVMWTVCVGGEGDCVRKPALSWGSAKNHKRQLGEEGIER